MSPENRRQHIESIVNTLQSSQLQAGSDTPISDFDKVRLLSNVGLLIHDGLAVSAAAIDGLTKALEQASCDLQAANTASGKTASTLNRLTAAVAIATVLLVGTGLYQGYQAKRQADIAEKQLSSVAGSSSAPASSMPSPAPKKNVQ